ncbi:MAG TPA: SDR family NAD(P)-dependent oxidoreductase [Smithellaceae bacterium]|nr:SDR family NAD(P)-dependent oxidoreductase [Smithellaceae bacterium]MDD3259836.1 SDR family NAD(P)-dependent oxidoreductase [Smithellaceae bacterium]HOG12353.1 SDR family NAD(P)-dependent oxidoreductase [Smithellaceae bacterium]HPL09311.1 SDR family NAD(P)-dependent oxidoreductase [Smithellaceae bacterium]
MIYNDLKGKTALVTGAGKKTGIGYAIAEKLASCGCNVIIADLGAPPAPESPLQPVVSEDMKAIASELAKAYAVRTLAVAVDVADNQAIGAMVETIKKSFDHIDILCNNAGASFGVPNTVLGYDEAAWMKTIDVNLFSVFRMSRAVLPLMAGKPASIINTASRAGKVPPIFNSAYAVAKAGVIMLTKVMAKELGGGGIRVNAICPGQIATDLEKWRFGLEASFFGTTIEEREKEMCKTIPLGYIGLPRDAGDLVAFLASDASRYITGQAVNLDGGQCMEL